MEIQITYFALMKEKSGRAQETLNLPENSTALSVYELITKKYGIHVPLDAMRVAINDEFADLSATLKSGDNVVFIPPVSGG